MPFIDKNPLQYPANAYNPLRRFVTGRAPTVTDYKNFKRSDLWLDTSSADWWICCYKDNTQATWRKLAGTSAAAELFTPDSGGQTGPDALNNLNLLGDSVGYANGIHFTGDPANNTLTAMDLRNITVYVVDAVAGQTEYQTVQAAINAANAAGGGTVYVRPGTYTEDLVLYDAVDITAAVATPAGYQTTIIGSHTPPDAGAFSLRNLALSDTTDILLSANAGATTIVIIDCITDIANGYTFNLPNWTGLVAFINSHCVGTEDGFIDIGTGAGDLLVLNSTIGVGTTNVAAVAGTTRITATNIQCNFNTVLQGITNMRDIQWIYTLLCSNDANVAITSSFCIQDVYTAINHTSTGIVSITNTTIESSGNPDVIGGTGIVRMGSLIFNTSASIAAGITQNASEYQITGPIEIIPSDESVAAEDAWIKFNIPSGLGYSFGIDNSDSDYLKLSNGVDPSTGTELLQFRNDGTQAHINYIYTQQSVANIAGPVNYALGNTDNSDPASDAAYHARVGASAGDPYLYMVISGTNNIAFGIDNSDSDKVKMTRNGNTFCNPSSGTTMWSLTTDGEITMPLQPAFLAYNSVTDANQTGNGAVATVDFDTEVFDQGADFAADTFTSPVTGRYMFTTRVLYDSLAAANTAGGSNIVTSNRRYYGGGLNWGAIMDGGSNAECCVTTIADMDAADTCYVETRIVNGVGDTVGIYGGAAPYTYFCGKLDC